MMRDKNLIKLQRLSHCVLASDCLNLHNDLSERRPAQQPAWHGPPTLLHLRLDRPIRKDLRYKFWHTSRN